MSTDRTPPHDLDAERALLGAMLLRPEPIAVASKIVTAADFYSPSNGLIFETCCAMHLRGEAVDPVTVARTVGNEVATADLVTLVANVPSTANVATYAQIVADCHTARLLIAAAWSITDLGYDTVDVGEAVDQARTLVEQVRSGLGTVGTIPVQSLDDIIDKPDDPDDWVIPGVFTRTDRAILVAGEGVGKSYLWRQIAILTAQGIHPFRYTPIPAKRTMLVDLENPERTIKGAVRQIITRARAQLGDTYRPGAATIWHQPAGIDIRTRVGFASLDQAFTDARPDLVCLGPLYKLYRQKPNESMEDAALDVTARLDDLRTRHGFGLFIEHHAPKGSYGMRDMTPFGSSIWMRWPEFGPALIQKDPRNRHEVEWGDWRPPREIREWPIALSRGSVWPWDATFA